MQPSSSTRATIVSAEIIVKATFSFCHLLHRMGIKQRRRSTRTILKWKSNIQVNRRRIVRLYKWYNAKTFLLRFLRRGHADDGCSCNHRAVPPSVNGKIEIHDSHIKHFAEFTQWGLTTFWKWHSQYSGMTLASWRLQPLANRLFVQQFVQTNNKANAKALHYWSIVRRTPLSPVLSGVKVGGGGGYSFMATDDLATQGAATSQTVFSDAFSWIKSSVFWVRLHWSLSLRVQLIITQH